MVVHKLTLAAKARPAVLYSGHPGTAVKVPVSLTRPVKIRAVNMLCLKYTVSIQ